MAAAIAGTATDAPRETKTADGSVTPGETSAAAVSSDDALLSGCSAVRVDGTCELGGGALRVWVNAAPGEVTIAIDGTPAHVETFALAGGARANVQAPLQAHRMEVARRGEIVLRAAFAPSAPVAIELVEAAALRDEAKLDDARSRLAPLLGSANEVVRARALGLAARIAMSRGDAEATDTMFAAALAEDDRAGLASARVDDAAAWIFSLFSRGKLVEAHREIERAEAGARVYPDGRARLAFYRGVLTGSLGHTRTAVHQLRNAGALAERLGLDWLRRSIRQEMACNASLREGGPEAYRDLVDLYDGESTRMSACERADLAQNIAYIALHDDATARDSGPWVERALDLYEDACPSHAAPEWTAALQVERAEAAIARGDLVGTRMALRDARTAVTHPAPRLATEWAMIDGALAEADHDDPRAERAYRDAEARASAIDALDARRRALEHLAMLAARRGERMKAIGLLGDASTLADVEGAEIPIGAGRERFLRAREPGDARRIDMLVQLGRPAEALAHLRRTSARVLASLARQNRLDALDARDAEAWEAAVGAYERARNEIDRDAGDDWRYSATTLSERTRARAARSVEAREALETALASAAGERNAAATTPQPLAHGEALLAIQTTPSGWLVFFAEGAHVDVRRLEHADIGAPPAHLAEKLLTPFAVALRRARRLTILASGPARRLDVHALPFEGRPLIARLAVVYSTGATARGEREANVRRALIVVDPTLDLASARHQEAAAVLGAVDPAEAVVLRGDDARGPAIRSQLSRMDLFHYAGHGVAAGTDGADSALPLSDHSALTASDVLALERAPSLVFLDGCTTMRDSGELDAQGLGMAQAFVVSGARFVIGATRAIPDRTGSALSRAFYTYLRSSDSPEEAFRAAQVELEAAGIPEWSAFRMLVPQ